MQSFQVCTPAINILEEMGVLKELVDNNEAHFADNGGLVSPSGLAFIGARQHPGSQGAIVPRGSSLSVTAMHWF